MPSVNLCSRHPSGRYSLLHLVLNMCQGNGTILEFPSLCQHLELLEFVLVWLERNDVLSERERTQLRSVGAGEEVGPILLEEMKEYVLKKK